MVDSGKKENPFLFPGNRNGFQAGFIVSEFYYFDFIR